MIPAANVSAPLEAIVIASVVPTLPKVPSLANVIAAWPVRSRVPDASGRVTVRSAVGSVTVNVVSNASAVAPSNTN